MIRLNNITTTGFPESIETWDFIAKQQSEMHKVINRIAGDVSCILSGLKETVTGINVTITDGYVCHNDLVYTVTGGTFPIAERNNIRIGFTTVTATDMFDPTFEFESTPRQVFLEDKASLAIGLSGFQYVSLKRVLSHLEINDAIANLQTVTTSIPWTDLPLSNLTWEIPSGNVTFQASIQGSDSKLRYLVKDNMVFLDGYINLSSDVPSGTLLLFETVKIDLITEIPEAIKPANGVIEKLLIGETTGVGVTGTLGGFVGRFNKGVGRLEINGSEDKITMTSPFTGQWLVNGYYLI